MSQAAANFFFAIIDGELTSFFFNALDCGIQQIQQVERAILLSDHGLLSVTDVEHALRLCEEVELIPEGRGVRPGGFPRDEQLSAMNAGFQGAKSP